MKTQMKGDDGRHPPTAAPLAFGGRVDSRLVDALLVAFGLFGIVIAAGAIGRGIRDGEDLFLLLLGAGMGALAGLFWRHIRRAHFLLHEDRLTIHTLLRSLTIPYADIRGMAVYTRYLRQHLYRPVSPYPEYMRDDTLLLRIGHGRIVRRRLPYSPVDQPVVRALSDRTGIEWEQLQGISAWKHRPDASAPRP